MQAVRLRSIAQGIAFAAVTLGSSAAQSPQPRAVAQLQRSEFVVTPSGAPIQPLALTNARGVEPARMDYGALVMSLKAARQGRPTGRDRGDGLHTYTSGVRYFGAIPPLDG